MRNRSDAVGDGDKSCSLCTGFEHIDRFPKNADLEASAVLVFVQG
jgi:hypothetical protein